MEGVGVKPFNYHVPRLKPSGVGHNSLSSSGFKIVVLILFLGLIGAASQGNAVLDPFRHDFHGKSVQITYLPLRSGSLGGKEDELLHDLFESQRLNKRSQLQIILNNDLLNNQTASHSSFEVPTLVPFISSENQSIYSESQLSIMNSGDKTRVSEENGLKEKKIIELNIPSSVTTSSNEPMSDFDKEIELLREWSTFKNKSRNDNIDKTSQEFIIPKVQTSRSPGSVVLPNHQIDKSANSFLSKNSKTYVSTGKRPRRSVVHLHDMIVCATGCNPLVYKGYGCYCGFLGSGLPVDPVDKCCAKHDWCYHHAKCPPLLTYFVPYYWSCTLDGQPKCVNDYRGWKGICGAHLCECDRQFAQCLRKYPCPQSRAMCMTSPWRFWQNLLMQPPPYG